MPDPTPNIGLQKPLGSESADISVLNENMDKIDLALGEMASVPTAAKDAAGAITELHEAIEHAIIPDATLTTKGKVQLSNATNTAVENLAATPKAVRDAVQGHADQTTVHGGTSAATANRLMIRDSSGRAKVAAPAANDDIARLAEINTRLPLAGGIMFGMLRTKESTGALTQDGMAAGNSAIEIPSDGNENSAAFMMFHRPGYFAHYFGLDTDNYLKVGGYSMGANKYRLWDERMLRINAGQLEFYNGTKWTSVGGNVDRSACIPLIGSGTAATSANVWQTLLNLMNKGYLDLASIRSSMTSLYLQLRITIDGVVKFHGTCVQGMAAVASRSTLLSMGTTNSPALQDPGWQQSLIALDGNGFRNYPYTLNETLSNTYCIVSDAIYFENSLKIEVMSPNATGSTVSYMFSGGYMG
ncbi:tail fiber protein [Paenibacillaceae bacterium WGS1546]|uniref:tail fiber protein n=1 Tax=Cohnella sp. WGS1546 TaxID=3366810 RepID=UPI00372D3BD7